MQLHGPMVWMKCGERISSRIQVFCGSTLEVRQDCFELIQVIWDTFDMHAFRQTYFRGQIFLVLAYVNILTITQYQHLEVVACY